MTASVPLLKAIHRRTMALAHLRSRIVIVFGSLGLFLVMSAISQRRSLGLGRISDWTAGTDSSVTSRQMTTTTTSIPQQHAPSQVVGFYNMYIPLGDNISETVQALIEEQLGQIATSYMMEQQQQQFGGLTILTIALGYPVDDAWLNQTCQSVVDAAAAAKTATTSSMVYNLTCILLDHYEEGSEMITLTRLHDYCVEHPHDASVMYLHDKGSFNPRPTQDKWRQSMTAAITAKLCYDAVVAVDDTEPFLSNGNDLATVKTKCSLCGALYQPLPGQHYAGNMWTARCSYIAQLLSPYDFAARQALDDAWVQQQRHFGLFDSQPGGALFMMADWAMGRDRYTAEQWVSSHPSVEPCDVAFSNRNLEYWSHADLNVTAELVEYYKTNADISLAELRRKMSPRYYNYTHDYIYHQYVGNHDVWTNEAMRKNDYFLLRGLIFRWLTCYGRLPDADSFVWDWFPDGAYWKERMASIAAAATIPKGMNPDPAIATPAADIVAALVTSV